MSPSARRLAAILVAAPLALALPGCSSSGDSAPPTTAATAPSLGDLTTGQSVDRDTFFKATAAAAEKDKTYAFTFELGEGGNVTKATGVADNTDPGNSKRQMTATLLTLGEVEIIVSDGQVYTKIAGQNGGKYVKGPVSGRLEETLRDTAARASSDASVANAVTYVGEQDLGGEKVRHFAVYVDPAKAQESAGGTAAGSPTSVPATSMSSSPTATSGATGTASATPAGTRVDYWLDSSNRARKRQMTYEGQPAVITYDRWGEPVTITVPPADQVIEVPGTSPSTSGLETTSAAPPASS
ncbi:MAG: hypothetical protein ABI746_01405 [Dermatophilaceae bacterium]